MLDNILNVIIKRPQKSPRKPIDPIILKALHVKKYKNVKELPNDQFEYHTTRIKLSK